MRILFSLLLVHSLLLSACDSSKTHAAPPPHLESPPEEKSATSIRPPPQVPPASAEHTSRGLATTIVAPGSGQRHPEGIDTVLLEVVDWSEAQPEGARERPDAVRRSAALDELPLGLAQGVRMMVVGETRRMWIPLPLTFDPVVERAGKRDLLLDVTLLDIEEAPRRPAWPPKDDLAAIPESASRTESGLAYQVLAKGEGEAHPAKHDRVEVRYGGWTSDGVMFRSSYPKKVERLHVHHMVPGWAEGVQLMSEGDKYRLWIPQELGYRGQAGQPTGMLVFDVELVRIL